MQAPEQQKHHLGEVWVVQDLGEHQRRHKRRTRVIERCKSFNRVSAAIMQPAEFFKCRYVSPYVYTKAVNCLQYYIFCYRWRFFLNLNRRMKKVFHCSWFK